MQKSVEEVVGLTEVTSRWERVTRHAARPQGYRLRSIRFRSAMRLRGSAPSAWS